jgi:hypothetical protein
VADTPAWLQVIVIVELAVRGDDRLVAEPKFNAEAVAAQDCTTLPFTVMNPVVAVLVSDEQLDADPVL